MENIIAAEILCTKLQESEKPLEIGIGMALKVVLDENITIEERTQKLALENGKLKESNRRLIQKCIKFTKENHSLKEASNILEIKLKQANAIIDLYKNINKPITQNFKKVKIISNSQNTPIQTSIQFSENIPTINISEEEKDKSIYYKSAKRRALKIWKSIETNSLYKESTKHIVNWGIIFHLMPGEPIKYNHIEVACMPKCYGGLGIIVGMRLEDWVDSQVNK